MVNPYPRWRLAEEGAPNGDKRRRQQCYDKLMTLKRLPLPDDLLTTIHTSFMWDMREKGFRRQYGKVLTELNDLIYFRHRVTKSRSMPNLAVPSKLPPSSTASHSSRQLSSTL